jgi:hypothetical protein
MIRGSDEIVRTIITMASELRISAALRDVCCSAPKHVALGPDSCLFAVLRRSERLINAQNNATTKRARRIFPDERGASDACLTQN